MQVHAARKRRQQLGADHGQFYQCSPTPAMHQCATLGMSPHFLASASSRKWASPLQEKPIQLLGESGDNVRSLRGKCSRNGRHISVALDRVSCHRTRIVHAVTLLASTQPHPEPRNHVLLRQKPNPLTGCPQGTTPPVLEPKGLELKSGRDPSHLWELGKLLSSLSLSFLMYKTGIVVAPASQG